MKREFGSRTVKRVGRTLGVPRRLLIYYGYSLLEVWLLVPKPGGLRSCCFWFSNLWLEIFGWFSKFQVWLCVCVRAPDLQILLLGSSCICSTCVLVNGGRSDLWSRDPTQNQLCYWAECKVTKWLFLRGDVKWPYVVRLAWKRLAVSRAWEWRSFITQATGGLTVRGHERTLTC